ncbi:carboxymuconolactone decarboxylase family protein [Sphaerisporangium krabiense]|uniref:AhpD family alkylhydroperoxidase n=1 Tax=Sphaerisporangium krabiense TaxID=763782 RepID=A0A7W8Z5H9_9ACTN|nr:carboxymuconolactone decarboxylase family protein [Sphaerisporangium krabiense]MBB5627752.1 AhpD family alkylhydroperoxidase [Sphaerisporangium krabiense]
MEPRMNNFAKIAADGYRAMQAVEAYLGHSDVPDSLLELVRIRASQINGCGFCLDMHHHTAKRAGETDERLFTVAGWREAPYYTSEERAALALTEAVTRLADGEGVPDAVWDDAADNFDEKSLAALVVAIAQINAWNRINVTIRSVAGSHRHAVAAS